MGLFNELVLERADPESGIFTQRIVQFKWGDLWDYRYRLGDIIRHENQENGGTVTVPGIASGDCAFFKVILKNWRLDDAVEISEREYDDLCKRVLGR